MKKNVLSLIIMLIAGIIVSVIGMIREIEIYRFVLTLLVALIIFFIIGKILQAYIQKQIKESEKNISKEEDILADKGENAEAIDGDEVKKVNINDNMDESLRANSEKNGKSKE